MNSYKPLISAIIAVYNGELYIEGAIKSIIEQSYQNYELLIIDGGSTDNTLAIIKQYENHIKFTISEPDNGIYDAWNKALKRASGEWITFIGSDDILYAHAFESYIDYIGQHVNRESLEFVSSRIEYIDKKMAVKYIVGEAWDWKLFKRSMITWHVGAFHSKKLFLRYGLFDDTYKISGDYELLLRPRHLLKAGYFSIITVRMRDGGISSKPSQITIDEVHRAKVKHKIISSYGSPLILLYSQIKFTVRCALPSTLYDRYILLKNKYFTDILTDNKYKHIKKFINYLIP